MSTTASPGVIFRAMRARARARACGVRGVASCPGPPGLVVRARGLTSIFARRWRRRASAREGGSEINALASEAARGAVRARAAAMDMGESESARATPWAG